MNSSTESQVFDLNNPAFPQSEMSMLLEKRPQYGQKYVGHIDLSAKLEQWTKDSAVALSNSSCIVLFVSKEIKQRARDILIDRYDRRTVRYRLFAILVFLVIQDELSHLDHICIDRDYEGDTAEATIKNLVLHLLRQNGNERAASFIRFANVKGSSADKTARRAYLGKELPTRRLVWEEIETQMKKLGKVTKNHNRRIA